MAVTIPSKMKVIDRANNLIDKLKDPDLITTAELGKVYLSNPTPKNEQAIREAYTKCIHTKGAGVAGWMIKATYQWAKAHQAVKNEPIDKQIAYKTGQAIDWAINNLPTS